MEEMQILTKLLDNLTAIEKVGYSKEDRFFDTTNKLADDILFLLIKTQVESLIEKKTKEAMREVKIA